MTKLYKDADFMQKLYVECGESTYSIAELLDCSRETIRRWLQKHDIDTDKRGRPEKSESSKYIYRRENDKNYVQYAVGNPNEDVSTFYEHQLVLIAEGAEPSNVFSENEMETHFENGCPLDTRPDNVELMDAGEHKELHEVTGFY